ncbi:MAG: hypothetical protein ACKVQC_06030 [Elusimicrobiota bacterium]
MKTKGETIVKKLYMALILGLTLGVGHNLQADDTRLGSDDGTLDSMGTILPISGTVKPMPSPTPIGTEVTPPPETGGPKCVLGNMSIREGQTPPTGVATIVSRIRQAGNNLVDIHIYHGSWYDGCTTTLTHNQLDQANDVTASIPVLIPKKVEGRTLNVAGRFSEGIHSEFGGVVDSVREENGQIVASFVGNKPVMLTYGPFWLQ